MKRIMVLANNSVGLLQFRGLLLRKLAENYEIIVVCPNGKRIKELQTFGCQLISVEIDRRGMNPKRDFALFWAIYRVLKKEKPDFVITYTIKPNLYGCAAARLLHIPYAANVTGLGTVFERGGLLKRLIVTMYRYSLKKADVVFFENSANRDIFVREKIIPQTKTCVLHGAGVSLEKFRLLPYPSENTPVRFLFMGRIMREKGIEELLSATQKLVREGYPCVLDVLGGYEENYQNKLNEYEKDGWLFYHGFQENVVPFIQTAHCFVLPSWHEGMANTNLECAASGRPVITSNIPGCREAVIEGVSGLLCEPKNAESLYSSMKKVLQLSCEERREMGVEGRRHMEEVFDKKKVVEETIRYLRLENSF